MTQQLSSAFRIKNYTVLVNKAFVEGVKSATLSFRKLLFGSILMAFSLIVIGQETLVGLTSTGGPANGGTAFSLKTTGANFSVHRNFMNGGYNPYGDIVRGTDGYYYGMTYYGGNNNSGVIFKMSGSGVLIFVKSLSYTTGNYPRGSLIQATDGNFYGMTTYGGANGYGTVFKMTAAGTITVIKSLDYYVTGSSPYGSLVQGSDGSLYGMASYGGANGHGTIFKITTSGTLTVLKHLSQATTGGYPNGSLVQGSDGAFYGMAYQGGTSGYGTIFKITSGGTFTVLKHLDYYTNGANPYGSLIKAIDGNLYGMIYQGGSTYVGLIFKMTNAGALTIIKKLDNTTGSYPYGSLVQGSDGNLYGMTNYGGANNYGTIFRCTPAGALTVLRNLNSSDGIRPVGSLYKSTDGFFYGMAPQGGVVNSYKGGTAFKISSSGAFSVLLRMPDGGNGSEPAESLVQAKDGFYYGMATNGGNESGYGTVYKLCTNGSFTKLRNFNGTNGSNPNGSLIQATDGYFYGTTTYGGNANAGTLFKMSSSGTITVLKYLSQATSTGTNPYGSLVQGSDGAFYGMTNKGGANYYGTIFKLTATGVYTVIKNLDYSTTGVYPYGSLVQGSDGNFYGMTYQGGTSSVGTIFKITPTGTLTILKHLNSSSGYYPQGSLIRGADGAFYGMTQAGGANGYGTIFKITSTGTFTVLKSFSNTTTGGSPQGDLVQGSDGVLYGMTYQGGTYNGGTIFKITTAGSFAVLRHLNPVTDGANPRGNLIIQKAGPVANPQTVSTPKNTTKKILLTASGGTPRTYKISTAPKNGTATITKDTLFYTPNLNYVGADSVYFTATWGCQTSAPAKIRITVTNTTSSLEESNVMVGVLEESTTGTLLQVKAMPNPSQSAFALVISSSSNTPASVRILDAMGRIVEVRNNVAVNGTIRIGAQYKPGLYYAEVVQGGQRTVVKLVKTTE